MIICFSNDIFSATFVLFQLNDNEISDWNELSKLSKLSALKTIYLERNPIYEADQGSYRRKVMLCLPQVTQIDATLCR